MYAIQTYEKNKNQNFFIKKESHNQNSHSKK